LIFVIKNFKKQQNINFSNLVEEQKINKSLNNAINNKSKEISQLKTKIKNQSKIIGGLFFVLLIGFLFFCYL